MENWRPSCNRITPAVMWMVQLNRWRLTSELGESGELCNVYCCTFIEFIHGIFQQDTHTHAHNGFLVASTVSCNSINNFSSGESPRRCVQSFMQIGEIAWEEFEKVGLWHFTNLEEKKCVCGRWYKIFECVMWCKSRMTIDYDIFSAGVMYIRLLSFGVCSGSENCDHLGQKSHYKNNRDLAGKDLLGP